MNNWIKLLNQGTTTIGKVGGVTVAEKSQCQTDIFSVTSPGNNAPPQICGTNTGEHSKYTIFFSYLKKIYFISKRCL